MSWAMAIVKYLFEDLNVLLTSAAWFVFKQDLYSKMIALSCEARKAYEDMVAGLQESSQDQQENDQDQEAETNALACNESSPTTFCTEEPAYSKWRG